MQEGRDFGQAGDPQHAGAEDSLSGLGFSGQRGDADGATEQRMEDLRRSAADTLDRGADRVEGWADEHQGALGGAARRTADAMERGADAVHGFDAEEMRSMIERQVRNNPVPSLLVAAAAGWLVGRILR
jgi:ElaB/YqjD/DUF883 family membrane-anchored ribosome-binding protein